MIADRLDRAAAYHCLGKRFQQAFRYLQETDLTRVALEKFPIDGEHVFALPQEYTTKLRGAGRWEAHRCYADIQYIVSGREQMGVADLSQMRITDAYDAEKDVMFLEGSGQFLTYTPGTFAIFMPHDVHMPGMALDAPEHVRKVVMKVAL